VSIGKSKIRIGARMMHTKGGKFKMEPYIAIQSGKVDAKLKAECGKLLTSQKALIAETMGDAIVGIAVSGLRTRMAIANPIMLPAAWFVRCCDHIAKTSI